MVKKIISVVLCMMLSVGLLCGCNLFVHNYERDYQRVIVELPEVEYSYTYSDAEDNVVSEEKSIPCYTYKGNDYFLSGGNVYYKADETSLDDIGSYSLFKNADGHVSLYRFAEDVLSDVELKEVKDILTSGGDEDHKIKYMNYNVTLPERKIYKTELANYVNNYLSSYVNNFGYSVEDTVDLLLDAIIVSRGLMINEAWKFYISGKIAFTQADVNYIERSVYSSIDSELRSLQEDILKEKDLPVPDYSEETEEEAGDTTYPLPPEEIDDSSENYNETIWSIENERNRWPGSIGDDNQISLELEAMKRFLIQLENNIDADFRITAEQRERAKNDIESLRTIQNTKGIEFVYPELGKTFVIDYLYRQNITDTYFTGNIEGYIKDELSGLVTVKEDEIQKNYEDALKSQKQKFDEDISNYDTAIDNGDPIYYHPDTDRYFFVKHILIQFSDEQKAYLEEFKKNTSYTLADQIQERNRLANEIKAYAHKDGEDDTSRVYSVNEVLNEVKAATSKYAANPILALREFDKLIYKFNQDPGSFTKTGGYAVRTVESDNDQWVKEFSSAARELNKQGKVGAVYPELIVTDYGVHIMIYLGHFKKNVMSPDDYVDLTQTETFEESIRESIFTSKTNNEYSRWQQENIYKVIDDENTVKIYKDNFKDFYKLG